MDDSTINETSQAREVSIEKIIKFKNEKQR